MRTAITGLCACIILGSGWFCSSAYMRWKSSSRDILLFEERSRDLSSREKSFLVFTVRSPVTLENMYLEFIGDLADISRVYSLGLAMEGAEPLFFPSAIEGLKEAKVKAVFSHIPRRGILAALLAVLDDMGAGRALVFDQITQENDTLVIEATLIGV